MRPERSCDEWLSHTPKGDMVCNLLTCVCRYSSRYEDGLEAVTHFTYQEPENDPRNFAYLWVARGPLPDSSM